MWEKNQMSLNLVTKPRYLNFLSLFQVFIVIFKFCLEMHSQIFAGIGVLISIFTWILISVKMKPYNYERLNRIWLMLLSLALWHCLISTIILDVQNYYMLIFGEYIGLAVIAVIGILYIKRAPDCFKEGKNIEIIQLFLFQFGRVASKYIVNTKNIGGLVINRKE